MRYYLNKRTGVAASKSWRDTCLMAFSEVDGRKDFNRRMNPFDSEVFLRDPDTKRVMALEAESYELLRDPDFTVPEDDPLAVEAMADWRSCIDDDTIEAIMSDPNWRENWLDPDKVAAAMETAINDYPLISASLQGCTQNLSDADMLRLLVATRTLVIVPQSDDEEDENGKSG